MYCNFFEFSKAKSTNYSDSETIIKRSGKMFNIINYLIIKNIHENDKSYLYIFLRI